MRTIEVRGCMSCPFAVQDVTSWYLPPDHYFCRLIPSTETRSCGPAMFYASVVSSEEVPFPDQCPLVLEQGVQVLPVERSE